MLTVTNYDLADSLNYRFMNDLFQGKSNRSRLLPLSLNTPVTLCKEAVKTAPELVDTSSVARLMEDFRFLE